MLPLNKISKSILVFGCMIVIPGSCFEKYDNENEIIYQTTDYEGIKNAVLFIKSGGATVGDSYQISIIPYQNKLKNSDNGNVFICDNPNRGLSADTSMIKMSWLSYDTLKITYNKGVRIFKANTTSSCCGTTNAIIVYDAVDHIK